MFSTTSLMVYLYSIVFPSLIIKLFDNFTIVVFLVRIYTSQLVGTHYLPSTSIVKHATF